MLIDVVGVFSRFHHLSNRRKENLEKKFGREFDFPVDDVKLIVSYQSKAKVFP